MLRDGEGECVEHYGLVIGLAIPEEPEPARPKLSGAVRFRDRELYPGLEIAGDSFESFLGIFRLCFQWLAWIRPIAPRMPTYCLHKVIEMWAVKTCARRCAGGGWGRPRALRDSLGLSFSGIFCRGFSLLGTCPFCCYFDSVTEPSASDCLHDQRAGRSPMSAS